MRLLRSFAVRVGQRVDLDQQALEALSQGAALLLPPPAPFFQARHPVLQTRDLRLEPAVVRGDAGQDGQEPSDAFFQGGEDEGDVHGHSSGVNRSARVNSSGTLAASPGKVAIPTARFTLRERPSGPFKRNAATAWDNRSSTSAVRSPVSGITTPNRAPSRRARMSTFRNVSRIIPGRARSNSSRPCAGNARPMSSKTATSLISSDTLRWNRSARRISSGSRRSRYRRV